jgi:microcystin-dependent protein
MDAYLGEIRMVGFNFAPLNWALCNGQILGIAQNTALFSLLGTYYGGNGTSNFQLPNLQAASPIGYGQGTGLTTRNLGESGGEPTVTLTTAQMAAHNHNANCVNLAPSSNSIMNNAWAGVTGRGAQPLYAAAATPIAMSATTLMNTGNTQPHNNLPPYLGIYFIICMSGIYPPRS